MVTNDDFAKLFPVGYSVDHNKHIQERILWDMKNNQSKEGVHYLFIGNTGTGKTTWAQHLLKNIGKLWLNQPNNPYYHEYNCREVWEEHERLRLSAYSDKSDAICRLAYSFCQPILIIDDLGDEAIDPNAHWFISSMLLKYYQYIKDQKCHFSIITTNLPGSDTSGLDIKTLYGDRILSRLSETHIVCEFDKHSFRKEKTIVVKRNK